MNDFTAFPIANVNIPALPDVSPVTDASLFIMERAGTGRVAATALAQYLRGPQPGWIGDGAADDTAAIQAQIDALATSGGVVTLPPGTYRITSSLKLRPWVTLLGYGATVKQGNGANLTALIDYNTYSAVNATVQGLIIDGNRANNTNSNNVLVVTSAQSGTTVRDCTFQNCPGLGVMINGAGTGNQIVDNTFNSVFSHAIYIQGMALYTVIETLISGNQFANVGFFCIAGVWADQCTIVANEVLGTRLTCNVTTAGTACTWVSGTQFTSLLGGMFIRIQGTEYQIGAVNSATSLTLLTDAGTRTNQAAIAGNADCINWDTVRNTVIANNTASQGMSMGIVVHNERGGGVTSGTVISGNLVRLMGTSGIALVTSTSDILQGAAITGNVAYSCGSQAANPPNSNNGIWIYGSAIRTVSITGNIAQDFGSTFQQWGVYVDPSVPIGQVFTAGNVTSGTLGNSFGTGWVPYTPTITAAAGSFTSVSATGRTRLADKVVTYEITVTIVTNGSAASQVIASIPYPAAANTYIGTGRADGVSGKQLQCLVRGSATTAAIVNYDGTYPGSNGETLVVTGTYEAA